MQRLPSILSLAVAVVSGVAAAGAVDDVYRLTRHGSSDAGVFRTGTAARGHCYQCHTAKQTAPFSQPSGLFASNDNGLCFTCHAAAGSRGIYQGQSVYETSGHWVSGRALWPGPTPVARPPSDSGKCLNCHSPHGVRDAQGLVPVLAFVREEALCLACHDATGPSVKNISQEVAKASAHSQAPAGRHAVGEGLVSGAFGTSNRHAECVDCHNPHWARADGGSVLGGVSRISVTNGGAGTVPAYTALPASDVSQALEYEVCFKCHSSWTTRPDGGRDKALELNPNNESFHPVEGAGKNQTAAMNASLAGGTGLPHLTTNSVISCSDCHASDGIPTTVSRASTYLGAVPRGPHGSNAASGLAEMSTALLRARYRVALKGASSPYNASDFTLCLICHAGAPFSTTSKNARSDTNFRLHGLHTAGLGGKANAVCRECHENIHGTRGASQAANRSYARLVSFAPNVTGPSGSGAPSWAPGTCSLRCHGETHNNENY